MLTVHHDPKGKEGRDSSWTFELSRWRVRLRRLRSWSNNREWRSEERASYSYSRSSLSSRCLYEPVVPPVRIPTKYRLQDRQRGVRVSGRLVAFTYDGFKRQRRLLRELTQIDESDAFEDEDVPDMRSSMAIVYTWKGRVRRQSSL